MRKLILLPVFCLMLLQLCHGQLLEIYGGPGYYVDYPTGWTVEEVPGERLVKISSESKAALLQVSVREREGRTAMECLTQWSSQMGYGLDGIVNLEAVDPNYLSKIDAHDGARGVFKHQEGGAELYMGMQVYLRNDYVCFLVLTCKQGDLPTTNVLNQMAQGFKFND